MHCFFSFRHCIVATGITCTTCDSDAAESVPLQKDDEAATSAVASAVATDSLPLDKSEEATESGGTFQSGFYQQGGRGGSGQFSNPYPNNFQQPYQGGFVNNYQGAGYAGSSSGSYSGYYSGFSSNLYNSDSYGVRSLRRARGGGISSGYKPMVVSVGKGVKTTVPLLKFLPAIKGLEHQVEYYMKSGNTTLFEISQKGKLGFLHTRLPLGEGSYALKIGSKLKSDKKVDGEVKSWFHKKKFNLKLIVKVV